MRASQLAILCIAAALAAWRCRQPRVSSAARYAAGVSTGHVCDTDLFAQVAGGLSSVSGTRLAMKPARNDKERHMLKRGIGCAMATVWGFGCVPQPEETQETIDNLVQAGFPADDIQVVGGAVITAALRF
jgi:hypothetical protein